jgi:outer membrane receptor for ferrienterochelin and colicin
VIFRRLDRDFLKNEPWNYAAEQFSNTLIQSALFSRTVSQPGAYVQDTISLADKRLTMVVGGRWDHFSQNGQNTFLPRISLSVSPLRNTKLTVAAGQYSRFPDLVELYGPFGTPTLRAERSTHLSAALEQSLGEKIRVRVEAYNRRIRDGVYSAASEFRAAGPAGPILYPQLGPILANSLNGYSRGIEVTLQRRSANRLSGWVSYALGYARFADTTTNAHFWSDFDQRHTVNVFGSYRLSKTINVSASARYGSNFPVAGYFGKPVIQGNARLPIVSVRNELRMPAYFRLDTRVNKAFYRKRSKTTLYAEITNLTNHANYQFWGFAPDYVRPYGFVAAGRGTFLPIIPSVGLSVEF